MRGPDATKFLQNLCSQDMALFKNEEPDRAAVAACFFNPKGRIMFDALIVKPRLAGQKSEAEIEYWIDIDSETDAVELIKHLKRMALRKKIVINDLSHIIKVF